MILKWPGGKVRVIPQLEKYLPSKYGKYFEPFFGGGALYFYLKPKKAVINDVNSTLMNFYIVVRDEPKKLINALNKLSDEYLPLNKEDRKIYYYDKREEYNKTKNSFRKSMLLAFLNKTGFNGMYRENSKGEFNIPMGDYKNPRILDEEKINNASELLKNCEILSDSYNLALNKAKKDDFVYLDPPYHPVNTTSSFTSYSKDDFNEEDQRKLYEEFKCLDKKGCLVMLSNSDTPLINELYKNYNIHKVQVARSINSKASGRGKVSEVVVTNYET